MATTAVQTTAAAPAPAATTRQATNARAAAGFGGDFNTFLILWTIPRRVPRGYGRG